MQFAQLAMTSVLRTRQLSIVAPSSFLIIVWNVLFGLLCFGDGLPSLHTAVGCTLVVGSLAYGERNVRARVVVAAGELKK
jgi:drug/metabolite transporter (DMT)-like permease|tara:strand:+ start:1013 stop:1252 length:240 start_codon:yes stop_codon:yes gene_type:complete